MIVKSILLSFNSSVYFSKFQIKKDTTKIPLGKIQINGIKDLTKVGSVLSKDYREPSIFDLEDLQSPPDLSQIKNSPSLNFNGQSDDSNDARVDCLNLSDEDEDEAEDLNEKFENSQNQKDEILKSLLFLLILNN